MNQAADPEISPGGKSGGYDIMVLLIDDQPMIGEAVRRTLSEQPDIHFHYCASAGDAVRIAEKVRPTVILQDLVMPGINGLTLLHQYRTHPVLKDIPVIVLSSKEDAAAKSEAFAHGASDYLVKLPDKIELIARIRHHSKAYLNQVQRDEAFRALAEGQRQLIEKNMELERLTNVDGLTGLSNRRYLNEFIGIQWRGSMRTRSSLAVLMVDVDDFKRYNDKYGHLAGDEVLKKVAQTIQDCCRRPTDMAARFGGEEFIVVLSPASMEDARVLGEMLCRGVEVAAIPHAGSSVSGVVTVSVGCASANPRQTDSFLELIHAADGALYSAKGLGKNRVVAIELIGNERVENTATQEST